MNESDFPVSSKSRGTVAGNAKTPRWGCESHQRFLKGKPLTILTAGIGLAKNMIAMRGHNQEGKAVLLRLALPRARLLKLIAPLPLWVVATEACSGGLRTLLIQGAKSAVMRAGKRSDRFSQWPGQLKERIGWRKTVVALAHKKARIVWAVLTRDQPFDPDHVPTARNQRDTLIATGNRRTQLPYSNVRSKISTRDQTGRR